MFSLAEFIAADYVTMIQLFCENFSTMFFLVRFFRFILFSNSGEMEWEKSQQLTSLKTITI